jgi:regulator of protease activity HflC (stomatin/prohibitin superfamily)
MIREKEIRALPGLPMLLVLLLAMLGGVAMGVLGVNQRDGWLIGGGLALGVLAAFLTIGLFMIDPGQGRVLQLFGAYVGTVKTPGMGWVNPFYSARKVSLRLRNFETANRLKVNDLDGNPIEMSAVVSWRVVDTAKAVFQVDNYEHFVTIAAEAAVRKLAMSYPYDSHDDSRLSLRGSPTETAAQLRTEVQERLEQAGVEVEEARISNLSYAPEIAQAMLRRQQASAVIAARQMIVEGSVGMVEMALARLSQHNVVQLDEDRKAAMVSNLLVVLCSESNTQPIINTGTIYQ